MWTLRNRCRYERKGLRYPTDLTDAEWALVAAAYPGCGARRASTHDEHARGDERDPVYSRNGVSVARFAKGFPAANHSLRVSRSVGMGWHLGAAAPCALPRHARAGGQGSQPDGRDHRQPKRQGRRKRGARIDPSGYDAGKKVKGKKRHILVDTLGLPLNVVVHPANIQDRDGGLLVLKAVRRLFPFIERIFADGGYQGEATAAAVRALGPWQLEIVKRSDHTVGFEVLPQRWIVERTFAWLGRCRRLAKDYENRTRFAVAYIHLATIRLMLRRLTRQTD